MARDDKLWWLFDQIWSVLDEIEHELDNKTPDVEKLKEGRIYGKVLAPQVDLLRGIHLAKEDTIKRINTLLSQKALAKRLGLSPRTVADICLFKSRVKQ
jgi:hypothetical protein